MDFKIGYNVKPKDITNVGLVIFEKYTIGGHGTFTDVLPTEDECTAYGYIYNGAECWLISEPNRFIRLDNNLKVGKNNIYHGISDDNLLVGVDNTINTNCFSNLIVGNGNVINQGVNNSKLSGTNAIGTANNSIVQGGNEPDIAGAAISVADIQNTVLMYGKQTTDGSTKESTLNKMDASYFIIPDNTAMYFNAEILAVRVGGTGAGTIGDYASWLERGVIINKNKTLSIKRTRKNMSNDGTVTNWRPTASAGVSDNFYIAVRGATDVTIEWASTIRFTEIRANVDLTPEGGE